MKQDKATNIVEVLLFCRENDLPARVVGKWVWLKFPLRPGPALREKLEQVGFRWSKRRKQFHHNCGHPSELARDYEPWDRYGSKTLEEAFPTS